ncbi:unnamed protein product [Hapterophycus canaliculatus]
MTNVRNFRLLRSIGSAPSVCNDRDGLLILDFFAGVAQVYNSIRVFITAYVWMTGFGNFSFFYLKVTAHPALSL